MTGAVAATGMRPQTAASPVLAEWFLGWDEWFGRRDPGRLRRYTQRLAGSLGATDQEVERQWLVLDWIIRRAAPQWLRAAGLVVPAEQLSAAWPVADGRALARIAETAYDVAPVAEDAHERVWSFVAQLAQPDVGDRVGRPPWRPVPGNTDPRRVQAWGGLADGTRSAVPPVRRLVGPACRAIGYDPLRSGDTPAAWREATHAMGDAAAVIAWTATQGLVSAPGWSWQTSAGEAWRMAHAAARAALQPVEDAFVDSAHELVEQMFRITEMDARPRTGLPPDGEGGRGSWGAG